MKALPGLEDQGGLSFHHDDKIYSILMNNIHQFPSSTKVKNGKNKPEIVEK